MLHSKISLFKASLIILIGLFFCMSKVAKGLQCYICFQNALDDDCWSEPEEYKKDCPSEAIGCQAINIKSSSSIQYKAPFQRDCFLQFEPNCLFQTEKTYLSRKAVVCGEKMFLSRDHFQQYFECRFEMIPEYLQSEPLPYFKELEEASYANMTYCICPGEKCNGKGINHLVIPELFNTTKRPIRIRKKANRTTGNKTHHKIDEEVTTVTSKKHNNGLGYTVANILLIISTISFPFFIMAFINSST